MEAVPLAGVAVGPHDLLDMVEERLRDEGLVATGVLLALERDDAGVVTVAQEVGDVRHLHGAGDLLAVWQRGKALGSEFFGEPAEGPFAGGVGIERPLNERGTARVDYDDADLSSFDAPPRVEVPDGRAAWGAANLGFLGHALEGFGGEVAGVELGDPGHDRVQELAAGGFVDVLLDRNEFGSVALQFKEGVGVVAAVAGEAVDLVEDDVVDIAVFPNESEHVLELVTVGGLGTLAPVDKGCDDLGIEHFGLVLAGLALSRQRIAFGVVILVGLLAGRDAQVDDGSLGVVFAVFGLECGRDFNVIHW